MAAVILVMEESGLSVPMVVAVERYEGLIANNWVMQHERATLT